ncbi:MAG: hypothetical protein BEN19_06515 [Epulopiscium sp. Nuni2H_MBin003]|nr:MAG: hypothetical protein BEN19_06515 [Epulopiscium sp. Nuni2H_MBin003]
MTPKVIALQSHDDYTLKLTFADGLVKRYDCTHLLNHGMFKIINSLPKFHSALIDDLGGIGWNIDDNIDSNIVWSNRIDICKDILYQDGIIVQDSICTY